MNAQVSYYLRTLVLGVTAALATCLLALAFGAPLAAAQEQTGGTVVAWGDNASGQSTVPTDLGSVTAVSAGEFHSLAIKEDGTVDAWGEDFYDQSSVPPGLGNVTAVSAGGVHSLALTGDGTVVAWGNNDYGQDRKSVV